MGRTAYFSKVRASTLRQDGTGVGRHYEAYEIDLLAGHEEFEAEYAAGRPIHARGLQALD